MAKQITAKALLEKHVARKDRVLLINPPVEETRYSWIRWNQPTDLLKIGGYLRSKVGCSVDLLDLMKPDADGHVPEEWLKGTRRYREVGIERYSYPMRRFGRSDRDITEWLVQRRAESPKRLPTQVWITSLCSYWSETVEQACRVVRTWLPDAQIVLLGGYPRLRPEDAQGGLANFIVIKPVDLRKEPIDLALYGEIMPPFIGLGLEPKTAIQEVQAAVTRKIVNFTFFVDDLGVDGGEPLLEIVAATRGLHRHLRFHVICGLSPDGVTPALAGVLADRKLFASINFEEADELGHLNQEAYHQACARLTEAGLKMPDNRLSGFVWIGRPGDELDALVLKSFQVLDQLGGLILKPFTPTPGTPVAKKHAKYLSRVPHFDWSPHFFPFAELNGITRDEYHDLYRMTAFLNEKVRSRSFDFLAGTLGVDFLRQSLKREVWKLEPSPLRVIN